MKTRNYKPKIILGIKNAEWKVIDGKQPQGSRLVTQIISKRLDEYGAVYCSTDYLEEIDRKIRQSGYVPAYTLPGKRSGQDSRGTMGVTSAVGRDFIVRQDVQRVYRSDEYPDFVVILEYDKTENENRYFGLGIRRCHTTKYKESWDPRIKVAYSPLNQNLLTKIKGTLNPNIQREKMRLEEKIKNSLENIFETIMKGVDVGYVTRRIYPQPWFIEYASDIGVKVSPEQLSWAKNELGKVENTQ